MEKKKKRQPTMRGFYEKKTLQSSEEQTSRHLLQQYTDFDKRVTHTIAAATVASRNATVTKNNTKSRSPFAPETNAHKYIHEPPRSPVVLQSLTFAVLVVAFALIFGAGAFVFRPALGAASMTSQPSESSSPSPSLSEIMEAVATGFAAAWVNTLHSRSIHT